MARKNLVQNTTKQFYKKKKRSKLQYLKLVPALQLSKPSQTIMPEAEVTEPVLPAPGKKKNRRSRGKKNKSASSENAAPQAEAPADLKAPPSKVP